MGKNPGIPGKRCALRSSAEEQNGIRTTPCEGDRKDVPAEENAWVFWDYGKIHGMGLFPARGIPDRTGITLREPDSLVNRTRSEMRVPKGCVANCRSRNKGKLKWQ